MKKNVSAVCDSKTYKKSWVKILIINNMCKDINNLKHK